MKKYILILSIFLFFGCAIAQRSVTVNQIVLLPEDRIYTVPKGQLIDVLLDGKPLHMVFPEDMKLVSPTTLVRQEEKLNNAILDKAQADRSRNKWIAIIGSVLTIAAGGFGVYQNQKNKKS